MLWRGLKTAWYHSFMHIDHFLKDAGQWQSHNSFWCRFVCTICVVEISVDWLIVVLAISEHVARCNPVVAEMFALPTHNQSGTYIYILAGFAGVARQGLCISNVRV